MIGVGTDFDHLSKKLALVVQTLDSAIQWRNHYPVDKYQGIQLRYPLDRHVSTG